VASFEATKYFIAILPVLVTLGKLQGSILSYRYMTKLDRPSIPSIAKTNDQSAAEQFQNETLRPIIKGLHELLIRFFNAYLIVKKGQYFKLGETEKPVYIHKAFKTDAQLKLQMRSMVVGNFTVDEFTTYQPMKALINKRTNEIILKRLLDSMSEYAVDS
jgi:hypothetical protein